MRGIVLLVAALAVMPLASHSDDAVWVTSMWPPKDACPPESTKDVKLEDVMKSPRAYSGQCVHIKGYYRNRALFIDPNDLLARYPSQDIASKDRRMGVSGADETLALLYNRYDLEYIELTGIIWQCEDTGPWMGGYCNYITGGPFIGVISVKAAEEPLKYRDDTP